MSLLLLAGQRAHEGVSDILMNDPLGQTVINIADNVGETPLFAACQINDIPVAMKLVKRGADVNAFRNDGVSCLMMAAFAGHAHLVKYLLSKGADRSLRYCGRTVDNWNLAESVRVVLGAGKGNAVEGRDDEEGEHEDQDCVVCMANSVSHKFSPCGHRVVCAVCVVCLEAQGCFCPVCRAHFKSAALTP